MSKENFAFVTLATDDNYGSGALVLAHSLKLVKTKAKLVVLVTGGVTNRMRNQLNQVFDLIEEVGALDSQDAEKLTLLERPELGVTFTKLHCWKLTQFEKGVFLDADTLVLKNCDELFECEELSAVPDVGWPDCFNSGMFVFQPSNQTFNKITRMATEEGSFDGGDQGLLNSFFSDWATKDISRHLSFIYNMNANSSYSYLPAFRKFGQNVKIVHFLGTQKPWLLKYDRGSDCVDTPAQNNPTYEFLKAWWRIYTDHVGTKPPDVSSPRSVSKSMATMSLGSPQKHRGGDTGVLERPPSSDTERRFAWEQGRIDYLGQDSYSNIQRKLDEAINKGKKDG